jgi:hypothetical protein
VYRGIRSRLTRSRRYCPLLLDFNEYQDPSPESKNKRGIIHRSRKPTNMVRK